MKKKEKKRTVKDNDMQNNLLKLFDAKRENLTREFSKNYIHYTTNFNNIYYIFKLKVKQILLFRESHYFYNLIVVKVSSAAR